MSLEKKSLLVAGRHRESAYSSTESNEPVTVSSGMLERNLTGVFNVLILSTLASVNNANASLHFSYAMVGLQSEMIAPEKGPARSGGGGLLPSLLSFLRNYEEEGKKFAERRAGRAKRKGKGGVASAPPI